VNSGCSEVVSEREVVGILQGDISGDPAASPSIGPLRLDRRKANDLGPMLARGQIIEHKFIVVNESAFSVRLTKVVPHKPCCSDAAVVPRDVAPGAQAVVRVIFRPGYQSGRYRIDFSIVSTNSVTQFVLIASLFVDLLSEYEVNLVEATPGIAYVGSEAAQTYQVICRRDPGMGRHAPTDIFARTPFVADFVGPEAERDVRGGIREAVRHYRVALSKQARPGVYKGEVRLRWSNGREEPSLFSFRVYPRIRVVPASVLASVTPHTGTTQITLECQDSEFRIKQVKMGDEVTVTDFPRVRARHHVLRLPLDPASAHSSLATAISIETDHDDQPWVEIPVVWLPKTGASP
jgi:hypothetical protein